MGSPTLLSCPGCGAIGVDKLTRVRAGKSPAAFLCDRCIAKLPADHVIGAGVGR